MQEDITMKKMICKEEKFLNFFRSDQNFVLSWNGKVKVQVGLVICGRYVHILDLEYQILRLKDKLWLEIRSFKPIFQKWLSEFTDKKTAANNEVCL